MDPEYMARVSDVAAGHASVIVAVGPGEWYANLLGDADAVSEEWLREHIGPALAFQGCRLGVMICPIPAEALA